ncbi:MAG: CPBP family intramembrane metalloprotease [Actinomycetia bacterium]|nr:CPBP family intramembrane metalloprotease [Actinomycetes bacterium]
MRETLRTAAVVVLLLGWSAVAPRIPDRWSLARWNLAHWNPIPHAVFGAAVSALSGAPLGLRPPTLWAGLRWGAAAAAPVVVAVFASTGIPSVREGMAVRRLPVPTGRWLWLRIPLGTVWTEEAAYRAALGTVAGRAFGASGGQLITAAAFGLSHVPDARATRESVPGTVLVTGVAGWIFGWLYSKSGSLAAPLLAHLAVNEAGALAALAVQHHRHSGRG